MAPMRILHVVLAPALALLGATIAQNANAIGDLDPADEPTSLSGSYLAGRSADLSNDIDSALAYLSHALRFDRGNPILSDRVLTLQLAAGNIEPALDLAEKLIITDNNNPTARIALAASAIKGENYGLARRELENLRESPLTMLTSGLVRAWANQGLGQTDDALTGIDKLIGPGWYEVFKDYHTALIADSAGRMEEAVAAITNSYQVDSAPLGIVEAYARIKARAGDEREAVRALTEVRAGMASHPIIQELYAEVSAGKTPEPVAANASAGAAQLFYGLGSAVGNEEGTTLAASYMQLAHHLDPSNHLVTLSLGDIYQRTDQCDKAIDVFERVPESSALFRSATIQIGLCLDNLGKTDDGANRIRGIVESDPSDTEAAIALGSLFRTHDRFAEAGDAYSIGIEGIEDDAAADWRIYYFRGIAYERTKRWDEAEVDFKRALEINPNQPQVLNYLGYSWVDMGLNLDEALNMIRTAVDLRPNDGYIIDSLGWAYYRLERFDEAVEQLERAVELRPEDPVINDHLGDAYWQVDRKREAMFQWAHARDLDPEEKDLKKILYKLENGLVEEPQEADAATSNETLIGAVDPGERRGDGPSSITVEIGDTLSIIAERVYGDPELFLKIFEANKERIDDPNVIRPGMTLTIPALEAN